MDGTHPEDDTDEDTVLAQAVEHMYNNRSEGWRHSPKTQSWDELRIWTQDRKSGELEYTQCGWDRNYYGVPPGTIRTGARI